MPAKIFICDDSDTQTTKYLNALRQELPGIEIRTFAHPLALLATEFDDESTSGPPRVIVLDLNFPVELGADRTGPVGHTYIPRLRARWPGVKILLVTELVADGLEIAIECLRERKVNDFFDASRDFSQNELGARVKCLLLPHGEVSGRGTWIVQLSDLHIQCIDEAAAGPGVPSQANAERLANVLLRDLGEAFPADVSGFPGVDLIVLAGDMTQRARPAEYDAVSHFLRRLTDVDRGCCTSILGRMPAIAVPGNHDVNWDISRARAIARHADGDWRVEPGTSGTVAAELDYLKGYLFHPFEAFYRGTGLIQPTAGGLWNAENLFRGASWDLDALGLTVLAANSSAEAAYHDVDQPRISDRLIREVAAGGRASVLTEAFRLAVIHHPLSDTSRLSKGEPVEGRGPSAVGRQLLRDWGTDMFMGGHRHAEVTDLLFTDNKALLLLGCGSPSTPHPEEPPHYNLVHLRPASAVARGVREVTVYSRILDNEKFVARPRSTRTFEWTPGGWHLIESR